MGQYYKPVSLDKKEYIYTHDIKEEGHENESWGQGLKLMEHSYIGNPVMNAVEGLLVPEGNWHKTRIIWAGDYADQEPDYPARKGDNGEEYEYNIYMIMDDEGTKIHPSTNEVDKKFKYLTNHTKKLVIDLSTIKEDKYGFKIHPLSLLTCEGNGRGGGDFNEDDSRVGTWARDVMSLEKSVLDGYELVDGQFSEDRDFIGGDGASKLTPDMVISG